MDDFFKKLNGPLFKRQRLLLLELAQEAEYYDDRTKLQLLEGLVHLCDDVAYIAHDEYGVDCLLTEDDE